jgi:hypothetical protein
MKEWTGLSEISKKWPKRYGAKDERAAVQACPGVEVGHSVLFEQYGCGEVWTTGGENGRFSLRKRNPRTLMSHKDIRSLPHLAFL